MIFLSFCKSIIFIKIFQGLLLLKIKNKNKILNTSTKPTKSSHLQPSNPTPLPLPEIPLFPHPQPCLINPTSSFRWTEAWLPQASLPATHAQPIPNPLLAPIIGSHGAVDFPIAALGVASISQLFVWPFYCVSSTLDLKIWVHKGRNLAWFCRHWTSSTFGILSVTWQDSTNTGEWISEWVDINKTFNVCGLDWRILSRGDNRKEKKREMYSLQEKLFLNKKNSQGDKPNFS